MGKQVGGTSGRYSGASSSWKSSWRGKTTLSQMCCLEGFDPNFYQNGAGPLDIDPVTNGFFAGMLVGISALPTAPAVIAHNGGVANEGWTLSIADSTVDPAVPTVDITFEVFGGAGVVGSVTLTAYLGPSFGSLINVFIPIVMYFGLPTGGEPDGEIGLGIQASPGFVGPVTIGHAALSAAYVNSAPILTLGADGLGSFSQAGVCIVGLTGGTDPGETAAGGTGIAARDAATLWAAAMQDAGGFVEIPVGTSTRVNTNGWRVDETAPTITPADPLVDFVGSDDLSLFLPGANEPSVMCTSPLVYWPDNIGFPYYG